MENAIVNGQRLGYIKVPDGTFVESHEINRLPANETMILVRVLKESQWLL